MAPVAGANRVSGTSTMGIGTLFMTDARQAAGIVPLCLLRVRALPALVILTIRQIASQHQFVIHVVAGMGGYQMFGSANSTYLEVTIGGITQPHRFHAIHLVSRIPIARFRRQHIPAARQISARALLNSCQRA